SRPAYSRLAAFSASSTTAIICSAWPLPTSSTARPSSPTVSASKTQAAQSSATVSMARIFIFARARCRRLTKPVTRLQLEAAGMQDRFGVAVRLHATLEDEVAGRLKGDRILERRCHRAIVRIPCVLAVDNFGHALHRLHDLVPRDDAVMEPVGHVLRG